MRTVSETLILYKILKFVAPTGFNITYLDKDDYADYQCGFQQSGSQISEYRDMTTGRRLEKVVFVTLDVTGGAGRSGVISTQVWMENVRDILLEMHNKLYYVLDGTTVNGEPDCTIYETEQEGSYKAFIRQVDNLSDPLPDRKNKQDYPVYTIDFKIIFNVGGN